MFHVEHCSTRTLASTLSYLSTRARARVYSLHQSPHPIHTA